MFINIRDKRKKVHHPIVNITIAQMRRGLPYGSPPASVTMYDRLTFHYFLFFADPRDHD